MKGAITQHGFEYGPLIVSRTCSDEKKGWVIVSIMTTKETLQVYVTKTGKVRIHGGGEWMRPAKDTQ